MKNLYLDPLTFDLAVNYNYNLRITETQTEWLSQKIENRLKTFYQEWFIDQTIGIPYYQRILGKQSTLSETQTIFITEIKSIPEVKAVLRFDVSFDPGTRAYSVQTEIQSYTSDEIVTASFSIAI